MPSFARVCEAVAEAWRERRDEVDGAERASSPTRSTRQVLRPGAAASTRSTPRSSRERVRRASRAQFEPQLRRLRPRAEVPAGDDDRLPVPRATCATGADETRDDDHDDARRDGRGRHPRPARRRLRPLLHRRLLARPALREDAVRQRAAHARVPARLPRHRRAALPRASSRTSSSYVLRDLRRSRAAASTPPRTPTPRASRASSTAGRSTRSARCAATTPTRSIALLRRHRGRELRRSAHQLPRQHPARRRPQREPPADGRARRGRSCSPARDARVRPGLDDKVLLGWNALFLGALTEAAAALDRDDWMDAARDERALPPRASCAAPTVGSCARGARRTSRTPRTTPRCSRRCCTLAELDDVAWLADARTVADELLRLFHDADGGGFFTTGHDAEALVVRPKDVFDDATPSANSLAANGLLRLAALTGDDALRGARASTMLEMLAAADGDAPDRLRAPARRARALRHARRSRSRSSATRRRPAHARAAAPRSRRRLLPASVTLTGRADRRDPAARRPRPRATAHRPRTCASTTRAGSR